MQICIDDNNNLCLNVEMYMAKREMTKTQERWNAVSVLPSPLYCLYFLCTAQWLTAAAIEEARTAANGDVSYETTAISDIFLNLIVQVVVVVVSWRGRTLPWETNTVV